LECRLFKHLNTSLVPIAVKTHHLFKIFLLFKETARDSFLQIIMNTDLDTNNTVITIIKFTDDHRLNNHHLILAILQSIIIKQ
jgi:hypothetical protein